MSKRTLARAVGAALATVGLAVATPGVAQAHECFIANRSAQATAAVGKMKPSEKGQVWWTLNVRDVIAEEVAGGLYNAAQGACVLAEYEKTGAPWSFAIMVKVPKSHEGVLGSKNPHRDEKAADHQGIDEIFAAHGEAIMGSYATCGVSFGEPPE